MNLNDEGFLIPVVNLERCIKCGICQNHCPVIDIGSTETLISPKLFAAWSKSEKIRIQSSSGGLATEIAKYILDKKGVVFGAAFSDSLIVKHIFVEKKEDLKDLRCSKYIQSHVDDAYKKAISLAKQGRLILFIGTPCQIAALNTFITHCGSQAEIYTCEVICHGVPSESVFRVYLDQIRRSKNSEIREINFRDKTFGWQKYSTRITFANGEEYLKIHQEDPFMIGFLKDIYLRPICYDCPFAKIPRISDITLGDYWGVPKELDDPRGVSVVIVNTPKGEKLFDRVSGIEKVLVSLEQVAPYNPRLINGHLERRSDREKFFKLVKTQGFHVAKKKYLKPYPKFKEYLSSVKCRFSKIVKKIVSTNT